MYKVRDKIKIKEQYIEYLCKYIKEKNLYNTKDKKWGFFYSKEKEYKLKEYYIETILSKEPLTIIRIYNQAVIVSELSFQIPLPLEIIEPLQLSWIDQKGE